MIILFLTAAAAADGETIVVTGRGLASAERTGAAVVTLDQERIRQSASGRLEDVLRDVAGVQGFRRSDSRSSHATNQSITLRGLGGNASARALLLLDGVPQNDPFGGWITFPAYGTDRIGEVRITRGGGSGFYGPGALAGTVELESATPSESSPVAGALSYGSRNSLDLRASGTLATEGRFVTLSAALARGDGFVPIAASRRGPIDRAAPYRQASGAARLVRQFGTTEAQFNLSGFDDRRDRGVSFTGNRGKGVDGSVRLIGSGATRWSLLAYSQVRTFASRFSSINADRTVATETLNQYRVPSRGFGFRAELAPVVGSLDLRIGLDGRFVSGETRELYQFVAASPTRKRTAGGRSATLGAFVTSSFELGAARLSASGRVDHWTISDGRLLQETLAGATLNDVPFARRNGWQGSGRLAGELRASPGVKLRAAGYRGWRLPTLNELYRPFRVGPDATGPNAALRPETLWGGEAGIDLALRGGWRAGLTGYVATLDDAIANVTLANGPGTFPVVGFVGASGTYRQRQNLNGISSRGFEADVWGKIGPMDARLSYALVDARVRAGGAAAPLNRLRPAQTPRHQLSTTLGWRSEQQWQVSVTGRAVSSQYDDDLNLRQLRGAFTLDGFVSWPLSRRVAMELRGENVFNKTVEAARSSDGVVERALPRSLWIGLRLR